MGHVMSILGAAAVLALGAPAPSQASPQQEQQQAPPAVNPAASATELADALIRQIGENLHVKAVVGKPVTVGSVTLIPILTIDLDFGGADLVAPAGPPSPAVKTPPPPSPRAGAEAFLVAGEARPLGFVVVTRQGTRFISVAPPPAK